MKRILLILFVIIIILLIIGFLLPANVEVERKATIEAPAAKIFKYANNLKNFNKWNPWTRLDSAVVLEYFGHESGEGAGYTWKSENKNVGEGKMTIVKSLRNDNIEYDLEFGKFTGNSSYITFNEDKEKTDVSWGYKGASTNNPFYRFMGFIMKKSLAQSLDEGLANLAELAANSPADDFTISIDPDALTPELKYVYLSEKTTMGAMKEEMEKTFEKLMTFVQLANIQPSGAPFTEYTLWDEKNKKAEYNVGIPVVRKPVLSGDLKFGENQPVKAVKVVLIGSYDYLEDAWLKVVKYTEENKLEWEGNPMEMYINMPNETPPEKLETHIYVPVK